MAALNRKSALTKRTMGLFKTLQDSLANGLSTPPLLEEDVPDDAKVLTVWLEKIEDLSSELSLDHNGLADAEVVFELNVEHGGQEKQTKTSSTRLKTLNPIWYPKERFQFVIGKGEHLPSIGLFCEVLDWDRMTQKEAMGSTTLKLEDIMAKGIGEIATFTIPLFHPVSSQRMTSSITLQAVLQPKTLAFAYFEETFYEFQRWQPVRGWGSNKPGFLLPTDPHRFFTCDGSFQTMAWDDILLRHGPYPEGHENQTQWHAVPSAEPDGWAYATKPDSRNWEDSKTATTFCRRRVWRRLSKNQAIIDAYASAIARGEYDPEVSSNANQRLGDIGRGLLMAHLS